MTPKLFTFPGGERRRFVKDLLAEHWGKIEDHGDVKRIKAELNTSLKAAGDSPLAREIMGFLFDESDAIRLGKNCVEGNLGGNVRMTVTYGKFFQDMPLGMLAQVRSVQGGWATSGVGHSDQIESMFAVGDGNVYETPLPPQHWQVMKDSIMVTKFNEIKARLGVPVDDHLPKFSKN